MKITDKINTKLVKFPKHLDISCEKLYLKSELTNKSYDFDVSDLGTSIDYYQVQVDLSNIPDGEYIYKLQKALYILSSGVIIIGDYKPTNKEYNNGTEYTEYKG